MTTFSRKAAFLYGIYVTLALSVMACAALGLQSADTTNQKLAFAYGQVTAARQSAVAALSATPPQMTVDEAKHVQAMADQARQGLDVAKGYLAQGNVAAATTQLQLEQAALYALQVYLTARGIK